MHCRCQDHILIILLLINHEVSSHKLLTSPLKLCQETSLSQTLFDIFVLKVLKRECQMCFTESLEERRLTKKVAKSDVGEGFAAKNCDVTHSKKPRDFAVDLLFEWLL